MDMLVLLSPTLVIGGLLWIKSLLRKRKTQSQSVPRSQAPAPHTKPTPITASQDMHAFREKASSSISKNGIGRPQFVKSETFKLGTSSKLPDGGRKEPPLTHS